MTSAMRFNAGKLQLSMTPASLSAYAAAALMYGAQKYERNNWRRGFNWTSLIDSLRRHLDDFEAGVDFDVESNLHHLAHIAANTAFLIEHVEQNLGRDDRYVLQKTAYNFLHCVPAPLAHVVSERTGGEPANDNSPTTGGSENQTGLR